MRVIACKLSNVVLFLCLLMLTACQQNTLESGWRDYLGRVATALRHDDLPVVDTPPNVAMPRIRLLQPKATQRSSIGMLEFLALDNCKLKPIIAARNSPLGKLAPDSQRLVYELGFLQHAPACIATLRREGRDELAAELAIALQQKKDTLAERIWQATAAAREFRGLWQVPAALGNYPESVSDELVSALQQLQHMARRWLSGDYAVDAAQFEQLLGTIRLGDAGRLHRALAAQAGYLQAANTIITYTVAQRTDICRSGQPTASSKIFKTVVRKFWLGKMQVHAASLNRRYYSLHEAIISLESLLAPGENNSYRNWRLQRDKRMQIWLGAPRQHVEVIQQFFTQCGITL